MTGLVVAAAFLAGWAVWIVLPPTPDERLRPTEEIRLPSWAKARPGALPSRTRWLVGASVGGIIWMYFWSVTAWVTVVVPLLVIGVWLALGRMESRESRRRRACEKAFVPECLDVIRLCTRAGQPLRVAVKTAVEVMPEQACGPLQTVLSGISVGLSDSAAWEALRGNDAWGSVASDLCVATAGGLPVERILDRHARSLRRSVRTQALTAAKAVGVRSVLPLTVCYLPAFVLLGVVPIIAGGALQVFR